LKPYNCINRLTVLVVALTFTLYGQSYAFPKKEVKKAVLLSIFLPGGGQFYLNNPVKGVILGSIQLTFLGLAGKNYLNYKQTNDPNYFKQAFGEFILFVGTWLYSVADAYVSSNLWDISRKIKKVEEENVFPGVPSNSSK